jgi:hypothetical protein
MLTEKNEISPKSSPEPENEKRINEISLKAVADQKQFKRDSAGGYAILAAGQDYPVCKICNEKMVLFLQFDLPEKFKLPFKAGSHLTLFMCRKHDEPVWWEGISQLPEDYMEPEYYRLILNPPGITEKNADLDPYLVYSELEFNETDEEEETAGPDNKRHQIGRQSFKVGGTPSWAQDPENHTCSCGAAMSFIGQVPQDFNFPKAEGAEKQPNSYSNTSYNLFLGNEVYIFACEKQCSPFAVTAVCQCD